MANLISVLVFPPLALYFAIAIHELGHVVCALLVGAVPSSCGVGRGRPWLAFSLGGTRFYLGRHHLNSGMTMVLFPQLTASRWQTVLHVSGGILANALVVGLTYPLLPAWRSGHWTPATIGLSALAALNALTVACWAVPYWVRIGTTAHQTDGMIILQTLFGRQKAASPADALRHSQALEPFLQDIGDWRVLRAGLVKGAETWCELGDPAHALELLERASAIPVAPLPSYAAYETGVHSSVVMALGDLDGAEALLADVTAAFDRLGHAHGLLLCELAAGGLVLRRGNADAAAAYYERLAAGPHIRRLLRHDKGALERFRHVAQAFRAGNGLEAILTRYEANPPAKRSPRQDLAVYRLIARCFVRAGDQRQAATAYAGALAALLELDKTFAGPDQLRFRLAQAQLLAEAQEAFLATDQADAAARLGDFFPDPVDVEKLLAVAREKERKTWQRRLRWGLALTAFNLAAIAALASVPYLVGAGFGDFVFWKPRPYSSYGNGPLLSALTILGFLLALYGSMACAFGLPLAAVSRWRPAFQRWAALLLLFFAIMPWAIGPVVFVSQAWTAR